MNPIPPGQTEIDRILKGRPGERFSQVAARTGTPHLAQQQLLLASQHQQQIQKTRKAIQHMKNRNIIMSAADHAELCLVIASGGKISQRARAELKALERELGRAQVVAPEVVPANVITMNSRAELLDLDTGERMEFTLVFPSEANIDEGKISVLAPLGTAMLGYRVGDEFEWTVPYGLRRLKVTNVHFQPEAALATAA